MRDSGRDLGRDVVRGLVLGLLALAVLGAIAARTGIASLDVPRVAGHGAWFLARATGFIAFLALALDVIVGLLVSTRAGDRWLGRGLAVDLHGWLSPLALVLVLGHAGVLLADGYVRFDALDVIVPFAAGDTAIALGIIAGYLAVAVHASFPLRRRLGARTWRRLHYLSFVAFVAATLHGLAAGTDGGHPWAAAIYATPLAVIAYLLVIRVLLRRGGSPA